MVRDYSSPIIGDCREEIITLVLDLFYDIRVVLDSIDDTSLWSRKDIVDVPVGEDQLRYGRKVVDGRRTDEPTTTGETCTINVVLRGISRLTNLPCIDNSAGYRPDNRFEFASRGH